MGKKTIVKPLKAETWSEINTAIEAASKEELLQALQQYHKRRAKALKA
ncbi:MAG: hypothetical protein QMD13_06465 [Candidatus Bathyarchaeia archaeon]|nr:hypothetical protein [Candidatus Bathyarchaeia archaeon]